MTRSEAIRLIVDSWLQRDSEFCVGRDEFEASERELKEALRALGVSDDEMKL